jgi:hypothetical protein
MRIRKEKEEEKDINREVMKILVLKLSQVRNMLFQ